MKSVSLDLAAHLAGPVTTLATCWRILRTDGVAFFFTDHDGDIAFDGHTYLARSGYSRTAIANDAGFSVDNIEIDGILDAEAITEEELRAGLFDHAEVRVFLVNWADPAMGALRLRRGWFGEVTLTGHGMFRTELRGLTQALQQRIGELVSAECRADLGDHRCRVPILPPGIARETAYAVGTVVRVATDDAAEGAAVYEDRHYSCVTAGMTVATQPVYDTTPGETTTDGTAVFRAEEAWTRAGAVVAVVERSTFEVAVSDPRAVDGWFAGGLLTWVTGANAGRAIEVKRWEAAGELEICLPMGYPVEPGDLFMVSPGCDKHVETCRVRFDNILNFRGEPFVPGFDSMLFYPDARG